MGQGPRKWRVSLDWVLIEENLLKVLEGNFDDLVKFNCEETRQIQEKKTKEILASIDDHVWKGWCTQWAQGILLNETKFMIEPLPWQDLKRIANARFLEVENQRLVWIGSSDQSVLNKIEDLRLPLLSLVTGTFPKSRTIRTRLIEKTPPVSITSNKQQRGKKYVE